MIEEIRERWTRATPGPWRRQVSETYVGRPTGWYIGSDIRGIAKTTRGDDQAKTDADAIAHAPEDIAFLLAEIERLTATQNKVSSKE